MATAFAMAICQGAPPTSIARASDQPQQPISTSQQQSPQKATHSEAADRADVKVLLDHPLCVMRAGIGANWHVIETPGKGAGSGSAWGGQPKWNDTARWKQIFEHASWLGMDYLRLEIQQCSYEPQKGVFTWDSDEMKTLGLVLDWAQAHGVVVLLQEMWQAVAWNALPGFEDRPGASAPKSMSDFAEGYATMVQHLVKDKGYTCIRQLNISNEPYTNWKGGPRFAEGYQAVRKALDDRGLKIPLAGPEYGEWEPSSPWLGAQQMHYYYIKLGSRRRAPGGTLRMPFYIGEFGMNIGGRSPAPQEAYDDNLAVAEFMVRALGNACDGLARWSFTNRGDLDGVWQYIDTYDPATRSLFDVIRPHRNTYYLMGLLTRFTAPYSTQYTCFSPNKNLTTALLKSPRGQYTLISVNTSATDDIHATFKLYNLREDLTLHRYRVTKADEDRVPLAIEPGGRFTLRPDSDTLTDVVPRLSVSVYSTYNLASSAPGIMGEEGENPYREPPIEANKLVWDSSDPAIQYDGFEVDSNREYHGGSCRFSEKAGSSYRFTFQGTNFRLYGYLSEKSGLARVYIDERLAGYANNYFGGGEDKYYGANVKDYQRLIFDSGPLQSAQHRVRVEVAGEGKGGALVNIDAVGTN